MICQQATLSGEAERPKVADAVIEAVWPLKIFQADDVLRLVAGMQQRQHRVYLVHRKRRLCETLY